MSTSFASSLSFKNITHQTFYAYAPQQNGVAKCKNHHLLEFNRALLYHVHITKYFWSEDVFTAYYFINCMPSSVF